MPILDLVIGAPVYCDGVYCGTVHSVVTTKAKQRITDVIVSRDSAKGKRLIVPVALIDTNGDQDLRLNISKQDLETCEDYKGQVLDRLEGGE